MKDISTFEKLPDEMILDVCQYLNCAEVLYSFFNLNSRLNATIADFYYNVSLRDITYKQFDYVATHIVPRLGHTIELFVFNGKWENILHDHLNTKFFHMDLSVMFPQLHTLLLVNFIDRQLNEFLDRVKNNTELIKLDIRNFDNENEEGTLTKILGTNNGRIKTVIFDDDSSNFKLNIKSDDDITPYPNIETLKVNVETDKSLEHVFRLVPNIKYLYVILDELSLETNSTFPRTPTVLNLTKFHLRSMSTSWSLEDVQCLLSRMPSLKQLALNLYTDDLKLINGRNFIKILPSSSLEIGFYFIYDCSSTMDEVRTISSTWPHHIRLQCLLDEPNEYAIIHTIPCDLSSIVLPGSLARKMVPGVECMRYVRDLKIVGEQTSNDINFILQHFRRLRKLVIGSRDSSAALLHQSTQSIVLYLPYLRNLYVKGRCDLSHIVSAAPNLRYLSVSLGLLDDLLDNTSTSELLQQRIVDLELLRFHESDSNKLNTIAEGFKRLTNLSISLKIETTCIESLLLHVLSLWKGKPLRGLYMKGALTNEVSSNFHQWLIDRTHLQENDSFIAEYQANWISLWLQ